MKKLLYFVFVTLFFSLSAFAQTEGINFQGLARNAAGEVLVSQQISLRLSVLLGSESGAVAYVETRLATTNPQGIFSLVVGDGNAISKTGNFSSIDWGTASKFIKVEMDPNAGNNFLMMGTTRMQAVPFAFHAYGVDAANVKGVLPLGSGGTGVASISELKASMGVDQINNTSDASKPISTATQAALNTKANDADVTSSLATKANASDVTTSLATKVDKVTGKELSTNDYTTAEKSKLAAITGTNTGDQDLSSYATATQLATKANVSDVTTSLAAKANASDVTTSLATKANASDVTTSLATKVDKVTGKELSTNDFTTAEKTKLAAITGTNTGDQVNITGNAGTATKLQTSRTINGIAFDGSADITLPTPASGIPYTGATQAVDLGAYELKTSLLNGITVGKGGGSDESNTVIGKNALVNNTVDNVNDTGIENTAIGFNTLSSNTTGYENTAIGFNALSSNTTGYENTAIGKRSLYKNTTGFWNTANGHNAMESNTTGNKNTASGKSSLYNNTEGSSNTANGYNAMFSNITGNMNTAYGEDAGRHIANGTTSNTTSDFSVYLGSKTKASADNAQNEIVIGYNAIGAGSNTIQLGNTDVTNVNTSGNLTVNGITVGRGGGNDSRNIAIGFGALSNNTNSGLKNTASGYEALYSNIAGDDNTASGYRALKVNIGNFNTASGSLALGGNTSGGFNTAFGLSALQTNETGSNNTAIGSLADVGSANLTNATAIGNEARVTTSNTIQLGNSAVTTIGGQVAWTAASDSRIKKNIVNSNYGLATVLKLRPVEYNLTSNDLKQVGFIAQEVQKLVPEVVTGKEGDLSKGEILGITYSNLVPVLTKAIQEQQKQIEEQNSKIAAQQKQIEELIKLVKGQ